MRPSLAALRVLPVCPSVRLSVCPLRATNSKKVQKNQEKGETDVLFFSSQGHVMLEWGRHILSELIVVRKTVCRL